MEKVKIISNEAGVCPYCNSEDIDYDVAKFEPNFIYYPCTCNKCKRYFEEWNELNFSGHNVGSSGEIEASDCLNKEIDYDGEYINDAGNDDKDIDWNNFDDLCEDYEDDKVEDSLDDGDYSIGSTKVKQKQPLQFKHIKDCWNALNKAESVNEVRELLRIFPRWSGDWWIDCADGKVLVCNNWYDRTCETWELDRETLDISYNED